MMEGTWGWWASMHGPEMLGQDALPVGPSRGFSTRVTWSTGRALLCCVCHKKDLNRVNGGSLETRGEEKAE